MENLTPFFIGFGLVIAYPVVAALILRATEPTRLELAGIGRELLTDPTVSEEHKQLISDMLDDVFDWRFMAWACVYFPASIAMTLSGRGHQISAADRQFVCDSRVSRFFDLHMRASYAAAPLWTVVFWIIAILTVAFAILFVGWSFFSQVWIDTVQHATVRVSGYQHAEKALENGH